MDQAETLRRIKSGTPDAISRALAALQSNTMFSEKMPEAKAPVGLGGLEEKYKSKSGRD